MNLNLNLYLEPSPISADGGFDVGRLPASIELRDLRDLHHPESPIRAIRAKCVDCSGGVSAEARKCVAVGCPLWPFRMGSNPFRAPPSEAQKANMRKVRTVATMARKSLDLKSGQGLNEKSDRPGTTPNANAGNAKPSNSEGRS